METGYHFPTYKRKIVCNTLLHRTSPYAFDLMPISLFLTLAIANGAFSVVKSIEDLSHRKVW